MKYFFGKTVLLLLLFNIALNATNIKLTEQQKNYILQNPTITVSNELDWYPYDFNDNGNATGYAVDYLKLLAKQIGLDVVFTSGTWSELNMKFKSKNIDILYPAIKTKEREEIALFSKEIVKMRFSLVAKISSKDIKSFEDMHGKTLALVKGWSSTKYIKEHYKNIKYMEFDTSTEMLEAVAFGLADGGVEDFFTANYLIKKDMLSNLHVVSKMFIDGKDSFSLYLMFHKNNKILKELFDKAMKEVKEEELIKIKVKWLGFLQKEKKTIHFKNDEKKYLKKKQVIKMCIDPNWMPLEMNKNGVHIGMTRDYMDLLEEEIGIPIKMVNTKTWTESLEFAKKRKCDILSLAMATPQRKLYMKFTKPYLEIPLVLVSTLDEIFYPDVSSISDKYIGIVKGYAYGEILKVKYPNIKLVEVENISDGLKKVEEKELFGFIGTLATVAYQIQKEYFASLKIVGKFDEKWELGIGVRNDDPYLYNILEKAISSIDSDKHQQILNKWISVKYDKGDYSKIYKFLVLLFLILMFIIYRQNQLKKHNEELEILSITDKLTGIYNRLKLDEVMLYEKNLFDRFDRPLSIILFDIDDFKRVNDTFGHKVGDEVLQDIAKIILKNIRKTDILGRWGGEEFLIICHETDIEGALELAEKFRKVINSYNFKGIHQLSASFGVAEFKKGDSIEKVFIKVDDSLYKAKKDGKNRVVATQ
jgi:polar amino acid transport system substrate-binding protein